MIIETDEMKRSAIELNQRQATQLEELELLRGNLNQMSQRSRNHSSDRPGQLGFQEPRIKTKPSEASRQSQSVEKFLNLKQSNQNVDNLISAWKQQKNSISLNNSMNTSIPQVICIYSSSSSEETPEYESPAMKTPQIVVEVDEYDDDHVVKSQQQVKLNNNVKISSRYPNTTRTNPNPKKEKMNISNPTPTQKTKTTTRPQTSKAPTTLKKTSATTIPAITANKNQNHMKTSLVEPPNPMKSSMEESQFYAQTPTQKGGKGSLLEKQRNLKIQQQQQQQKSSKKVQVATQQQQEERQLIQQLSKLKDQVLKCYENGQILHSQNVISKNFDQIINIMKLDFKCLENND